MKTNKLLRINNCIIAFVTLLSLQSCMNYYKISKAPENTSTPEKTIETNVNRQRYFILRNGDSAYHMDSIKNFNDSLTCRLETLPPEHRLHLRKGINGKLRYKNQNQQPVALVLYEVHVYEIKNNAAKAGTNYTLMYNKIQKIEVLEKDKARTATSYILGSIGVTVSVFAFLGITLVSTGAGF